jgi:hypothetical protein
MKKKKRRKTPSERNFLVPLMLLNCKPAAHPDKKKEAARKACRMRIRSGWEWPPGPFSPSRSPSGGPDSWTVGPHKDSSSSTNQPNTPLP